MKIRQRKKRRILRGQRTGHKKHHNTALASKVAIRRWLMDKLGGSPRVLDCFCAGGVLWERAYGRTGKYLGLDLQPADDARATIACDSRRYLRHVDAPLVEFDLFDLDAYGSPLEHLVLLCLRLRELLPAGRRVGVVLTDGAKLAAYKNQTPRGLLAFLGLAIHKGARVQMKYRDDILRMGVQKALELGGLRQVESRVVESEKTGPAMRYVALLLEREVSSGAESAEPASSPAPGG